MLSGLSATAVAALPLVLLLPQLAVIAAIDLRRFIIPDPLNGLLFASGVGVLLLTGAPSPLSGFAASLLGAGALYGVRAVVSKRTGREALGLGDVKFMAAAGVWTGLAALPTVLVVASLSGLAYAALRRHRLDDGRIPFGPFLALGVAAAAAAEAGALLPG